MLDFESFLNGYVLALLVVNEIDHDYDISDIDKFLLYRIRKDCNEFIKLAENNIWEIRDIDWHKIGYDFFMSKYKNESGFTSEELGVKGLVLHKIARMFKAFNIYINDQNKIALA